MKPWGDLTAQDKREAIGRRLGWTPTLDGFKWMAPGSVSGLLGRKSDLPDWPTADGLAFTEVLPELRKAFRFIVLRFSHRGCQVLYGNGPDGSLLDLMEWQEETAEAICRAAYELLPEVK